ncbi:MAG: FmdB family zinc ribbon protein [Candidatus Omnitrophota bacterium]
MPTYDYECLSCGDDFEAFQKMSDAPLEKCPKCKGQVKRLIGCGTGLIFKGSGFYSTDYKKSNSPKPKKNIPEVCAGCDKTACSGKSTETKK